MYHMLRMQAAHTVHAIESALLEGSRPAMSQFRSRPVGGQHHSVALLRFVGGDKKASLHYQKMTERLPLFARQWALSGYVAPAGAHLTVMTHDIGHPAEVLQQIHA
jgi:hypothetical protein